MLYRGSCHCGRVTFEAEGELDEVAQCNCSICSKIGALRWVVPRENFRLLCPEENLGSYTFNKHNIKHRFCPNCGCALYGEGMTPSGVDRIAVNARCLDGVDLFWVKVRPFDGRSL